MPEQLARLPKHTSVGRIWRHALPLLATKVELRIVGGGPRSWWRARGVDVWLADGHQGPLEVRPPVVAHLLEAAWADPALRPLMEPWFVEHYEGPSAAAAAHADRIITISGSSKQQIVAAYGLPEQTVTVAHLGVDHAVYHPGLPAPDDLLAAAGGAPGVPYVLFVSTVHPRKNLPALREALALLAAEGLAHPLVLVAGPAADRTDSLALNEAAVAPIPGIAQAPVNLKGVSDEDVARLMAGAAAFCLPSLMEGFGMAVAEAMACGTPAVVSDRGSLPEVVGDAGVVTGVEADQVAAGLREVLGSPERRAALGAAAHRRAAAFTWEAMVDTWVATLQATLDDRG